MTTADQPEPPTRPNEPDLDPLSPSPVVHLRLDPGRLLNGVAVSTALIGAAVIIAPAQAARLLDAEGRTRTIRAGGLLELGLAPALVWGRPRWAWATARAALTLAFAAGTADHARQTQSARAAAAAATMAVLAYADCSIAAQLKQAGR